MTAVSDALTGDVRTETVEEAAARVRGAAGDGALLETEGLALARTLGLGVPRWRVVDGPEAVLDPECTPDLDTLFELREADRVVVKAISRELPHKSEVGAVRIVPCNRRVVAEEIRAMTGRLAEVQVDGFGLFELIPHEPGLAGELLFGMRRTEDFGPVVTIGAGGIETELLAASLAPGQGNVILSPTILDEEDPEAVVRSVLASRRVLRAATEPFRGRRPAMTLDELTRAVVRVLDGARRLFASGLEELELNPVALTPNGLVALDAAGRFAPSTTAVEVAAESGRSTLRHEKITRLLAPRTVAVMGVSERTLNPGRIILRNMLRLGFPPERLSVVKEGDGPIDGCRRVPDLAALSEPVDLLVLAVAGEQVPGLVEEVVAGRCAESLVVIPGGLGETEGSGGRAAAVQAVLAGARTTDWGGPVLNGGNCLGVRSIPGRIDTLFIPRHKLRFPESGRGPDPVALISQSGAFAIARASKLRTLAPRYLVTVGNQLDLTVGDYVEHLVDDPDSRVVACYVEGFQPGDGERFLEAARRIVGQGRTVILYRAGRTAAGARASASHTASVAGDFAVSRELAQTAGVVVADTLADFEDLVNLFTRLDGRRAVPAGAEARLGALTNAGFEAVAIADRLGPLRLAEYSDGTRRRVGQILATRRLEEIVSVGNPLDVTPMMDDEGFAEAARAVLDDGGVDLGVIGCVPLTGAMETVAPYEPAGTPADEDAPEHDEDGTRPGATADRLARLWAETTKPWLVVVDSGALYDPMVRVLEDAGVPVLRSADRAVRLLGRWWVTATGSLRRNA